MELKHKFLILSVKAPGFAEDSPMEEVKNLIETAQRGEIQQIKLDVATSRPRQQQSNDLSASVYEESKSELSRSMISAGQLSEMRLKRAQVENFLVTPRQKKKIEEKQELTRQFTKLKDDEATHIRKSQELASIVLVESRSLKQGYSFVHVVLALLAGLVVGSLLLRS